MKIFKWLACRFNNDQFGCILVAIISVVVALFLFAASNAHATEYSIGMGVTHTNLPQNGIWWQDGYYSSLPHNVPSLTVRADNRHGDWGVGYGYMYEGNFQSYALAVASDAAYAAHSVYPASHWYGNQTNQGLFLVGRRYIGKFFVEAGPMLTRNDFTMTIPDCRLSIDPAMLVAGNPHYFQMNAHTWQVQAVASVGYQYSETWSGEVSYIPTNTGAGQIPGIAGSYSVNATLLHKF
jgi:hypothetical protein